MCHETAARPPLPPIGGGAGAASSRRVILDAADGNRARAFSATAIDPEAPGVVVLPDVRGLHPFYDQLAVRFAEAGVHATAMDYFGRTAGIDDRDETFDFKPHRQRIPARGRRPTSPPRSPTSAQRPGAALNVSSPSASAWAGGSHSTRLRTGTTWTA